MSNASLLIGYVSTKLSECGYVSQTLQVASFIVFHFTSWIWFHLEFIFRIKI